MLVVKRDGTKEEYDVEKIHKVVETAVSDVANVSLSNIEMNANLSIYNNIPTKDIQTILIKSANDLISEETPNYQYVAAKLLNIQLRKEVWKGHEPVDFYHHIQICIDNGVYDNDILVKWTKDQIDDFGNYLKHDRDNLFTYAGLQQMTDKYLVKNRSNGKIYETPQLAYMLIAMCLFDDVRKVKEAYDCYSTFKISLATPVMAGVRTVKKQFSSCVLVNVDDDLDSIFASSHAVGKYTASRAGIGLNIGRLRPINSPIRGGEVLSTGLIPYLKMFESSVKCTSQNGLRGGSATVNIPFWHFEIEDVLVLKNNAGTDDNRVRKLDYCVHFNKLFYERLVKNENITLFSPHEAVGLYDNFVSDKDFKKLYEKYESSNKLLFQKTIPARKLAEIYARERLETGRIYSLNIDHVNNSGCWNVPIEMTNLCLTGDSAVSVLIEGAIHTLSLEEAVSIHQSGKKVEILSRDMTTREMEFSLILNSGLIAEEAEVLLIEDEVSGLTVKCTPDHKIYTKNRGYVKAGELKSTDILDLVE